METETETNGEYIVAADGFLKAALDANAEEFKKRLAKAMEAASLFSRSMGISMSEATESIARFSETFQRVEARSIEYGVDWSSEDDETVAVVSTPRRRARRPKVIRPTQRQVTLPEE